MGLCLQTRVMELRARAEWLEKENAGKRQRAQALQEENQQLAGQLARQ